MVSIVHVHIMRRRSEPTMCVHPQLVEEVVPQHLTKIRSVQFQRHNITQTNTMMRRSILRMSRVSSPHVHLPMGRTDASFPSHRAADTPLDVSGLSYTEC